MKTVIITGANGQLGEVVTQEFLKKDYQVVAVAGSEEAKNKFIPHPHLDIAVVNLTNEQESAAFVRNCIEKYKTVDAALLLVGGFAMGNLAATSGEDLHRQIELNFNTAYHITRPLFEHLMTNKKGHIIFIGARPALQSELGKDLIAYALSKSLLFKLAEFLNAAAKGNGVQVSVIVPSTLDTPINRKSMPNTNPDIWVKPAEIAQTLEFLISDKSRSFRETVIKMYGDA